MVLLITDSEKLIVSSLAPVISADVTYGFSEAGTSVGTGVAVGAGLSSTLMNTFAVTVEDFAFADVSAIFTVTIVMPFFFALITPVVLPAVATVPSTE